jgi:cytochrome c biogenesis protein CcmG/thiol:disulfide interchange protein DsbE
MKQLALIIFIVASSCILSLAQKQDYVIPSVEIKKLDGSTFNTENIKNDGKPMIIDFWATWCSPCKAELNAIAEDYADWQKETGVVLYAISIDDARNVDKVAPYVNGKGWEYQVLLDVNGDFKRAMNVNNVPHVFVINGNREVVYQQNSAAPGDDKKLYEIVKKLAKGEKIN